MDRLKNSIRRNLALANPKLYTFIQSNGYSIDLAEWTKIATNPYFVFLPRHELGVPAEEHQAKLKEANGVFYQMRRRRLHRSRLLDSSLLAVPVWVPVATYRPEAQEHAGTLFSFAADEASAAVEFKLRFG